MDTNDGALLTACRRGDQTAWDALVVKYQRLVYGVARRAGLDADAASDVFQSVFVQLVASLDRIEHPDRLRAWLITTTKRLAWRQIARRRTSPVPLGGASDDDEPIDVADPAPLADAELEQLELQQVVREAVGALDPRCRELVELLFYTHQPATYDEVAARLGVPVGSVGPTRARCLKKLMAALEKVTS